MQCHDVTLKMLSWSLDLQNSATIKMRLLAHCLTPTTLQPEKY